MNPHCPQEIKSINRMNFQKNAHPKGVHFWGNIMNACMCYLASVTFCFANEPVATRRFTPDLSSAVPNSTKRTALPTP